MNHSDVFANIRAWAPRELLDFLDHLLRLLPEEFKLRLKQVLDTIPAQGDNMQKVLELVRSQWSGIQSDESLQIAVVGPAQTGKSSLVNVIRRRQADSERIFNVVDTPALEEYLGYQVSSFLPEEVRKADVIVLVLDARYEISEATLRMDETLRNLDKPVLVALNKIDTLDRPGEVLREARERLQTEVLPVSTFREDTIDRLLRAIVDTNARALYPLTHNFPDFRGAICDGIVSQSSFAASLVGAMPIPVSDLLPLTAIQTAMVLKIARAFDFPINRERARELIPMLVLGTLIREGSHRLRQKFPRHKGLIAVTVAGFWTFILGQLAIGYFEMFSRMLAERQTKYRAMAMGEIA